MDGYEKIRVGKLTPFQNSPATKSSPEATTLTLKLKLRCQPIVMMTSAFFANNTFFYTVFFKNLYGKTFNFVHFYQFLRQHDNFFVIFYKYSFFCKII